MFKILFTALSNSEKTYSMRADQENLMEAVEGLRSQERTVIGWTRLSD